jgi:hypothetical protein
MSLPFLGQCRRWPADLIAQRRIVSLAAGFSFSYFDQTKSS